MSTETANIPALSAGRVAVITGAAGGIGLATARRLASAGMKVVLADLGGAALDAAGKAVAEAAGSADKVLAVACDVSKPGDLKALADTAYERFGEVSFLMNNAGVGNNPGKPWENLDGWKKLIDVNLWGVVHGVQAFGARMLAQGTPAVIVNTGSKQGITTPPGNLCYNVSKAALKSYTEGLAHALRNEPGAHVSAHLLIPGFTFTGMSGGSGSKAPARGRRTRWSISCWSRWRGATSTSSAPTTRPTAAPTSGAWPGPSATSSRTALPCRAGIRILAALSRISSRAEAQRADQRSRKSSIESDCMSGTASASFATGQSHQASASMRSEISGAKRRLRRLAGTPAMIS